MFKILLLATLLLGITFAAVVRTNVEAYIGIDKCYHIIAFSQLMLALVFIGGLHPNPAAVACFVFGILIEIVQQYGTTRGWELGDVVANCVGFGSVWLYLFCYDFC
jgi:VanZ family protein